MWSSLLTSQIQYCISQGGLFGPTLWISYINTDSKFKPNKVAFYAGDTTVVSVDTIWDKVRNVTKRSLFDNYLMDQCQLAFTKCV